MLLIVIVNFRSPGLTIDCLRSLAPQMAEGWRTVVVDGGSGDDSVTRISHALAQEGWSAWASILPLDHNGGFAYANNAAIAPALKRGDKPKYIWLLNPDTIVHEGAAAALVHFMQEHPRAGILGSRLENRDGSVQNSAFRFPGILSELENGARLKLASHLLARWVVAPAQSGKAQPADWVSGASFFVRHEVFDQIGLLDDGYFMYYEELDFCRRAARAQWERWYVPDSRVVHLVGQSSGIADRKRRVPAYWFASRRRYFLKHLGLVRTALADLCWAGAFAAWRARRMLLRKVDDDPPHMLGDFIKSARGRLAPPAIPAPSSLPIPQPAPTGPSGAVAIGRNEGERLQRCLQALQRENVPIVYVDSGSSDGSVALAQGMGADVVELDMSKPFTAARARNAGFERLMRQRPDVTQVQFLDGDCELCPGWLQIAQTLLNRQAEVAAVAGRLKERQPDASIYNRLCDMEWDVPAGEAAEFGGIVMLRVAALRQSGGYNAAIIAGEEPELAVRLRLEGWKIIRVKEQMALHDAAMTHFGQWWKRNVRAGHAYAEGAAMHGRGPSRHGVKNVRSNWAWGLGLPLVSLALLWLTWGLSLLLLGLYGALYLKIVGHGRRRGLSKPDARLLARYTVLGKFPQMWGQMKYHIRKMTGRQGRIIEHKAVAA